MEESIERHLVQLLQQRIVILDGAMGTMIQQYKLQEEDFHKSEQIPLTTSQKGNNDLLNITRPDIIADIHRRYLEAGADIIETNTFNAQRISQADYGCEDLCKEINRQACAIARKAVEEFMSLHPGEKRMVAGSIGPTNKTCSLATDVTHPEHRDITFDELADAYGEQIRELLLGRVDILLIETIFDTLNAKAALFAADQQMSLTDIHVPIILSVTLSGKSGRTLSGQTLAAFLASVEMAHVLAVGLNCSFGPTEMKPFVEELAGISPYYLSLYPNAGLPNELGGYDISPSEMASLMNNFASNQLVNIIGGCCGTTDRHIAQMVQAIKNNPLARRPRIPLRKHPYMILSGLDAFPITPEQNFINIGERCNVAGSRKFLRLISNGEYEQALDIAHKQVEDGAQIIDINMDDGLLDAEKEIQIFLNMMAADPFVSRVPVMIDSSNWNVITAALKCVQGKCIVNSISLKEGEEIFLNKARHIRKMGAAVIVMAFDEEGQACSYEQKIHICQRAYNLLTEKLDFPPQDIIFDPNVLSIGTGIQEHDNYALNFINATAWIRQHLPYAHISGGISNLSFSFRGNNYIREAMHAVFLYHAISAGMDMGIVNPASRVMYDDIPLPLRNLLEDLIFNRHENAADHLLQYIALHKESSSSPADTTTTLSLTDRTLQSLEERLVQALVEGSDSFLETDLAEALQTFSKAVDIIEGPLIRGMGEVGERFASGKMFLPQVVRTAKIMQKAVTYLSPHMASDKSDSNTTRQGTIVMATVKGDVHDIGKNIVAVVLRCNNFCVHDLGVMCPAEQIANEAIRQKADMVGLCGLITPSLTEMINVANVFNQHGIQIPIIIGGATTNELHTALKIAPVYKGPVIWSKDAAQTAIIATQLVHPRKRATFLAEVRQRYESIRIAYTQKQPLRQATMEEARTNKLNLFNS